MARRRKTSSAEDWMDLIALLPWWLGLALAVLSYFVLHAIASAPLPELKSTQQVGQLLSSGLVRAFANVGQFIVPFICVMGAMASAVRRSRRKRLVEEAVQRGPTGALDGMSWREFEMLVSEGFRRHGYAVTETGGGGADGGVDLVLKRGTEKFLVQCKQWRAQKVGVTVVRELYGVMAARGAAGGYVVTSGRFTDEARAFASGRNVQLMDGPALLQHLRSGRTAHSDSETPKHEAQRERQSSSPDCPACGGTMVKRVARQGARAGQAFWGCSRYPTCRGTRAE